MNSAYANTSQLTFSGSMTQINALLATLSFHGGVAGSDTITMTATDSNGGVLSMVSDTVAITPSSLMTSGPSFLAAIAAGTSTATGFAISDSYANAAITTEVTTTFGSLFESQSVGGYATVSGTSLDMILSGSSAAVNNSLSHLMFSATSGGSGSIQLLAHDLNGGIAQALSVAVSAHA
jgi:hypothetical protein